MGHCCRRLAPVDKARGDLNLSPTCLYLLLMATSTISLARLSRIQKLRLMERLWQELTKDELAFASPRWHAEVLAEREALVKAGQAHFSPWPEVKKRLRRVLS